MVVRTAAISTGPDTHLDHLAVLSSLLKIPLILTDDEQFTIAQTFYPEVEVYLKSPLDLSLEYIATNFDVLFECGKFWAIDLLPLLELFYKKRIYFVFCPHGNSEKGRFIAPEKNQIHQDVSLMYGKQMFELLEKNGSIQNTDHIIFTGNYRFSFYLEHQTFYDKIAQEKVFSLFPQKKRTIFYAPTWADKENPTAFLEFCEKIIEELPDSFNLLIKLHPLLEEQYPAHIIYFLERFKNNSQVVFLRNFPSIYPLLNGCDIYLGDFSSVGYDFLTFNKPMYFFNFQETSSKEAKRPYLYQCGMEIPSPMQKNLFKFIEETFEYNQMQFSLKREEAYDYAFGEKKSISTLKEEITEVLMHLK